MDRIGLYGIDRGQAQGEGIAKKQKTSWVTVPIPYDTDAYFKYSEGGHFEIYYRMQEKGMRPVRYKVGRTKIRQQKPIKRMKEGNWTTRLVTSVVRGGISRRIVHDNYDKELELRIKIS